MHKMKWMSLVGLSVMILFTGCAKQEQPTNAAPTPASTEVPATKEAASGTLSFYTSQPDEDAAKLVAAFNQRYPEIKVETFRSGTEEVISKIQAEKQAGNIQADVLLVADAVTFEGLKAEDMLLSYKSTETEKIPAAFVDKDGTYTGTKIMSTALVVNTEKVKALPDSWKVLIDSAAKGQSLMPSPLYSGAAAYNLGVFTRNNNFGWDFYKSLHTNEVTVTKGNGGVLKAVAAGEKSYGMVVDFIVARAKKEGSPVELIYPKEGVPVITEPIGIIKNTDNKPAAKTFVDFVLSKEGQKTAASLGYTPIREGVEAPEGLKTVDQLKVLEGNTQELYKSREADKKEFGNVFGN